MTGENQPKILTKDEINALPLNAYRGRIIEVPDQCALKEACSRLSDDHVLGFDTETRPAFKKGEKYHPALIQLAGQKTIYLIYIKHLKTYGPLIRLFGNRHIIKSGVALKRDVEELQALFKFKPAGFLDLALPAKELGYTKTGLRSLLAHLMGFRISKQAQRSNWARHPLTGKQKQYAATDAWAGRILYRKLEHRMSARLRDQLASHGNWY